MQEKKGRDAGKRETELKPHRGLKEERWRYRGWSGAGTVNTVTYREGTPEGPKFAIWPGLA